MNDNDIRIFHAHTGAQVVVNSYYFLTLDELKQFCCSQFGIPSSQLFLLSSFGSKLKSSSLEQLDEVYVFDKNLFSAENANDVKRYIRTRYSEEFDSLIQPIMSPLFDLDLERMAKKRNSRQLIGLLTTNYGWISAIESDSSLFVKKIKEFNDRINVLFKSLKVANQYIDNYCMDVNKSYDSTMEFLIDLQTDSLNMKWKPHFTRLEAIHTATGDNLSSLLNKDDLQNFANESLSLNELMNKELSSYELNVDSSKKLRLQVDNSLDALEQETRTILTKSDANEILRELKLLSSRVQSDTKHLLEKTSSKADDIDIDIILETFQLHKRDFVPKIYKLSVSLYQIFHSFKELFSKLQVSLSSFLKDLSQSQLEMVTLRESLKNKSMDIERIQDLESSLAHVLDLPLLNGLYIVETIRRRQWLDTMKALSSKTNEKFANFREREIKTRSTWIKNYGDVLRLLQRDISDFHSESLVTFEMNINGSNGGFQLEDFTYDDAFKYLEQLKNNGFGADIINVLMKSIDDIPQRLAKLKIDDLNDKSESKDSSIKGYKTRIKKLENLLHQEQFKNFQQWPSSDRMSLISRHSMNEKLNNSLQQHDFVQRSVSLSSNVASPSTSSEEYLKLQSNNDSLSKDIKRYKNTLEALTSELKTCKQSSSVKDFDISRLQKQIDDLKDEHAQNISRHQMKLTEVENSKNSLQSRIDDLESEISSVKQTHVQKSQNVEALKTDYESKINELESKLKEKIKNFEEIEAKLHDKEANDDQTTRSLLIDKDEEISRLKAKVAQKDTELEEKSDLLKERDSLIVKLNESNAQISEDLSSKNKQILSMNAEHDSKVNELNHEHERLSTMKNDLLENMSNREDEFAKEKGVYQEEIDSLKSKLDECQTLQTGHDAELSKMNESHAKQSNTIFQLVIIINSLIIKSRDLTEILVGFYEIFCSSLKSIGLLAVKDGEEINIIRVKGLRKPNGTDLSATMDLTNGLKPIVEQDVIQYSLWTALPNNSKLLELSNSIDDQMIESNAESLDNIVESLIENYNLTTFESKYLKFVEQITNLNSLYASSVSKRFKEVEHLAKKELKENRKLKEVASKKISVRDFSTGDLVLFLPTRNESKSISTSWAAFNDMGDVKYLMKNEVSLSQQKQWFIGRILEIEEVDNKEYLITTEEVAL